MDVAVEAGSVMCLRGESAVGESDELRDEEEARLVESPLTPPAFNKSALRAIRTRAPCAI